jgi:hypothetical protein
MTGEEVRGMLRTDEQINKDVDEIIVSGEVPGTS